jgi:hypothetical protein
MWSTAAAGRRKDQVSDATKGLTESRAAVCVEMSGRSLSVCMLCEYFGPSGVSFSQASSEVVAKPCGQTETSQAQSRDS